MIEIISGTNRPGSNALRVSKLVQSLYEAEGAAAQILDLQVMPAELFLPSAYAEKPASFAPLQGRILNAKGLHIVVPEYNGSFPGVLKYFIDMLKFPDSFEHRAVTFTGEAAGVWGGIRAVEQLQMVFNYRNAFILPHRTFLTAINGKFDAEGRFTDAFQLDLLKTQVRHFVKFSKNVCA